MPYGWVPNGVSWILWMYFYMAFCSFQNRNKTAYSNFMFLTPLESRSIISEALFAYEVMIEHSFSYFQLCEILINRGVVVLI